MAPRPEAIRLALAVVAGEAADQVLALLRGGRDDVLAVAPDVTGAYVLGSSALALDWYEELREEAAPRSRHLAVVPDWERAEKYGRAVAWATEPMVAEVVDLAEARSRLTLVTEHEVFGGFTTTTEANVRSDTDARGWRRVARAGACKFCLMLADRGAVYRKESTGHFAAHTSCRCGVVPVFRGGDEGPEASVIQYVASKRRTSAKDRARVRAYLNEHYPDAQG